MCFFLLSIPALMLALMFYCQSKSQHLVTSDSYYRILNITTGVPIYTKFLLIFLVYKYKSPCISLFLFCIQGNERTNYSIFVSKKTKVLNPYPRKERNKCCISISKNVKDVFLKNLGCVCFCFV